MRSTLTHSTMYTRLRQQEIAKSTKIYASKGNKVKRCENCQMALSACMWAWRPNTQCDIDFVVLMHRLELFKPTNTGRLIADAFPTTHVYLWSRTEPELALLALLNDVERECFLVFPCQASEERPRTVIHTLTPSTKKRTLILLDGSWRQCSRMAILSRWLDAIPCLSLPADYIKSYAFRDSGRLDRFSTVEAAISCLQLAESFTAAQILQNYYALFHCHYLATRGNYQPEKTDSHLFLEDTQQQITNGITI